MVHTDMKTVIFLLFPFLILQSCLYCATNTIHITPSNGSVCTGNHCITFPKDIYSLENVFQSDSTVVFERGIYHISSANRGGLVQVQHVTNLSIVGYGQETRIVCSSNATFGFSFHNVSGLIIAGITISQCSATIPQPISELVPLSLDKVFECNTHTRMLTSMNVTAVLVVAGSENVTVSDVSITESPGFAVVAIDGRKLKKFSSRHPKLLANTRDAVQSFNLIVKDSDLSQNKQGSLLLFTTTTMCSSTVFSDNTVGIMSFHSSLSLRDVVVLRSAVMSVEGGRIEVNGTTSIEQSETYISKTHFEIFDGNLIFSGSKSTSGLNIVDSSFNIVGNSSVHFTGNHLSLNASALIAHTSSITVEDNATLLFSNNTATDLATVFSTTECKITTRKNATVLFQYNSVTTLGTVLSVSASKCGVEDESVITFQNNMAQDGGRIVELVKSELDMYHSSTALLSQNNVRNNSEVFVIEKTRLSLHNHSSLNFTQNIAENSSTVFDMFGEFKSEDNTKVAFSNNLAIHSSHVIISRTNQRTPFHRVKKRNVMKNNNTRALYSNTGAGQVTSNTRNIIPELGNTISGGGNGIILVGSLTFPPAQNSGRRVVSHAVAQWYINAMATISFDSNQALYGSSIFTCIQCCLYATQFSVLSFTTNLCTNSSYVIYMESVDLSVRDKASIAITNNSLAQGSALLLSRSGNLTVMSTATLSVLGNSAKNSYSILLFSANAMFLGSVLISENDVTDFGNLYVINSKVYFQGNLECSRNKAESGTITATTSNIFFSGSALFLENRADNGGAMTLITSVMNISPSATVNFTRNYAKERGGAVYVANPPNSFVCNAQRFVVVKCSFILVVCTLCINKVMFSIVKRCFDSLSIYS